MRVSRLAPDAFEKVLVLSYQRDSAEAHRMMADIGNELDLYTLAEELPDTDDLLDSEDDAPIIRLINAMLTEAIKESLGYSYRNLRAPSADPLSRRRRAAGNSAPAAAAGRLLISRIKVMASRTLPKSGSLRMAAWRCASAGEQSTYASPPCPPATANASSCVCWTKQRQPDLLTLGMPPALLDRVDALIARPHGIIRSPVRPAPGKARRSTPPSAASTPGSATS